MAPHPPIKFISTHRVALAFVIFMFPISVRAQAKPDEIKIVVPTVNKASATVSLPAAFWNTHEADWIETALSGRPSNFLHETLLAATTTRTLLENALRDSGCRDGDAWVDSINDFPRLRGDQLLLTLSFTRDGKTESFTLDELLSFHGWNASLGPYGLMFRGDPDRASKTPASQPEDKTPDSAKILRDDPQIALVFKGLQSMTQTFADHPLAYIENDWLWSEINRDRNHALLTTALYDSNGTTPVTLTFQRVSQTELLQKSAALWHDKPFADFILKQLDIANRIDKNKSEYLALRQQATALNAIKPELRDAQKEHAIFDRSALLTAQIAADYATLDAAWSTWSAARAKFETTDAPQVALLKEQATHWQNFMTATAEQAHQLALAQAANFDQKDLILKSTTPPADAQLLPLRGKETEARSRALLAQTAQPLEYWQAQRDKLKLSPNTTPDDIWTKHITAQINLASAQQKTAAAGIALGVAQQSSTPDDLQIKTLRAAYLLTNLQSLLAQSNLDLLQLDFEINKRQNINPKDPELPALLSQRQSLQQKIQDLTQAITQPTP